jgi:hypothetical protein
MASTRDPDSVEGVHVIERQEDKTGGDPTLADIAERMDAGFAAVNKRFDAVDERFEKVDQRFDKIDERFEKVDDRFESLRLELRGDIKDLEAKFDGRFGMLARKIDWIVGLIVAAALAVLGIGASDFFGG